MEPHRRIIAGRDIVEDDERAALATGRLCAEGAFAQEVIAVAQLHHHRAAVRANIFHDDFHIAADIRRHRTPSGKCRDGKEQADRLQFILPTAWSADPHVRVAEETRDANDRVSE